MRGCLAVALVVSGQLPRTALKPFDNGVDDWTVASTTERWGNREMNEGGEKFDLVRNGIWSPRRANNLKLEWETGGSFDLRSTPPRRVAR